MAAGTKAGAGKTTIPSVPIETPMFIEDQNSGGGISKHLTRTWIIFFERLAKKLSDVTTIINNNNGPFQNIIGWDIQDPTVALDVSDPVIPPVAFAPNTCRIRVKSADSTNPFQIDIRKNGVSIFTLKPIVPANAGSRTVHEFSDFTTNLQIAENDDVVIDILQGGGNWWVAVYLIGAPI